MATIAQILPALESGGVESHCLEIAGACANAGHRSLVISAGGSMVERLDTKVEHFCLDVGSKNLFTARIRAHALADLLQREGVQIVHCRSRAPAWLILWARRILAKREYGLHIVASYHGFYKAKSSVKKFYNSVMIRADHVVPNSHAVKAHIVQQYGALPDDRVTVIPEGVDFAQYPMQVATHRRAQRKALGLPETGLMFLQVGRLSTLKGAAFLAEMLAAFPHEDWFWVLAGEHTAYPEEMARIDQALSRHCLQNRVHYLGVRRDLAQIYPAADILLSGSLQPEAFGRTVIEASACGVPAFVPDQGGTGEVVLDDLTGWQYPLGNADGAVRRLAAVFAMTQEARDECGLAALAHIRTHYRLSQTEQMTLKIYAHLLSHG